jgi:hypothetical protein
MHFTGLDLSFWAATFLGHLVLLFVLWKRHRVKQFPFFTTLISTKILRTIALYMVMHLGTRDNYFYTYWSLAVPALIADHLQRRFLRNTPRSLKDPLLG